MVQREPECLTHDGCCETPPTALDTEEPDSEDDASAAAALGDDDDDDADDEAAFGAPREEPLDLAGAIECRRGSRRSRRAGARRTRF